MYSYVLETAEVTFIKLHKQVKHDKEVCLLQDTGFYVQSQGHNRESDVVDLCMTIRI